MQVPHHSVFDINDLDGLEDDATEADCAISVAW